MLFLNATVKQVREVNTKYGQKTVIDAIADFKEETIWRPAGDALALSFKPGQSIQVAKDSKGKLSLVDNPNPTKPYPQSYNPQPQGETYQGHNGRSPEIADYIGRLAKLYKHCYKTASQEMGEFSLGSEDTRTIATTLFIQSVKHFDL